MSPKQSSNIPSVPHGYQASGSSAVPGHLRVASAPTSHSTPVARPAAPQPRVSNYSSLANWAGTPTHGAPPHSAGLPASQQHITNHSSRSNRAGASTHASVPPPAAALPRPVNASMPNPSPALRHETSYPAAPTSSSGNLLDSDSDTSHWAHVVVPLLLKQYETNMYPTREETKAIAERLRVSQLSIDDWFRNRRWRLRKTSQPSTVQSPVVESNPPSGSNRIGAKEKQRLEEEFLKDSEMWQDRRVRLARELGLDEKTITSWFYMKRKLNPPSSKPGI